MDKEKGRRKQETSKSLSVFSDVHQHTWKVYGSSIQYSMLEDASDKARVMPLHISTATDQP